MIKVKLLRFNSDVCHLDTFFIVHKRQANSLKCQSDAL